MSRKYFGTDGVRGEVGKFPITPEFVMKLGYAAGRVLVNHDQDSRPTVLIGKDTRISGYMLEAALQAGFTAAGVNVLLTGPLPTPGIAYLTRALRLEAGVVISASHNPFQDNGIKFFAEGGNKLDDALELEIEAMLEQPMATNVSLELGRARRIDGAAERYIEFCKSTFPNELSLKGLKLVVDCANGATYHIAPKVFHELGAELVEIGCEPSGYNINDKVGATYPKTLQAAVVEHHADFGIALDGDGDRLIMVDAAGSVYDGDQLIYIIAKARAARGELKGGVVGTVMTNLAMELALGKQGVPFGRAKVGDRYVLEMLHADGWQVGGEASGHILCLDKHSTGDGIISSLQVLASLKQLGMTMAEACGDWQPFPQTLINVRHNGCDWKRAAAEPLAQAETALQGRGRVVLRPSGTEPVVRVMVEADDKSLADTWARTIAQAIEQVA
ncbi:phosphoglucosamine mutase [Chromobacterium sphagni]|uniref:Phosphoglucosamine mutase n=1 Tax=Chromobacterium sphagni TaxID=1903179 RepID=A0A1S1X024_9NEIS|nr:phosphoglucosamine mutase [Chromobacterium sphagni]OHX12882.1 phosphoglucosamine mutase [Chromobacterium sphagni]OHX19911.1 phosphoglucosamine mutase [Chromobacterium sphagni]